MIFLIYALLFIISILLFGVVYEIVMAKRDRRRFSMPDGDIIEVGNNQLHAVVSGNHQAGQPTVILQAGVGGNSLDWLSVHESVEPFARVVRYDRVGYGYSNQNSENRTPQMIVNDLHQLLNKLDIEPPYILVGHSFGGLYMLQYATQYDQDVAGIVLVDGAHPDIIKPENTDEELKRLKNVERFKRLGILRMTLPRMLSRANHLPTDQQQRYIAYNLIDSSNVIYEAEPLFRHGISLPDLLPIPITVISRQADEDISAEEHWQKYQTALLDLSPQSQQIFADTTSHYIMLVEPQTVVQAIQEMITTQSYRMDLTS